MISMNNSGENKFNILQKQIEQLEAANKPVQDLVKQQIQLLQEAHDEFIVTAQNQGYSLNNQKLGEIEVRQYSAMKQLAQKIGLPVKEYDEAIKKVRIRIFGEANYKRFFENQ